MISPLSKGLLHSPEATTRAGFWHERKWHWIIEAIVFAILGLVCAWPIIGAGAAMLDLFQRLSL